MILDSMYTYIYLWLESRNNEINNLKKIMITNNSSKMFIFFLPNLPFSRIATENRKYIMGLCPQRLFLYFLKI